MARKNRLNLVIKTFLVLACLVIIIPNILRLFPLLIGMDNSYIVLSGSMQPTLRPGDIVFIVKVYPSEIEVGDIIAVKTNYGTYMHRVIEKIPSNGEFLFKLKGDANKDPDPSYVKDSQIIGKMVLFLPTGYFCTKSGYALFVILPTIFFVLAQVVKIHEFYYARGKRRRGLKAIILGRRIRRRKIIVLDTISISLLIIIAAGISYAISPLIISGAMSYFTDVNSAKIIAKAATWKVESSITCSISPNSPISLGHNITVSGRVEPAHGSILVTLKYENNGSIITRTVMTDNDGTYRDVFKTNSAGIWTVQASWRGNHWYYSATSPKITFEVIEEVANE